MTLNSIIITLIKLSNNIEKSEFLQYRNGNKVENILQSENNIQSTKHKDRLAIKSQNIEHLRYN